MGEGLLHGAAEHLLVELGELAADGDSAVAEGGQQVVQGLAEAMWGLEGHEGVLFPGQRLEGRTPFPGLPGQEAEEEEAVGGQARYDQGRRDGGGAGDSHDRDACGRGRSDQLVARIADEGHAGVGDQGNCAVPQGCQEGGQLAGGVGVVEAGDRGVDIVAGEELAGRASVLGGDEAGLAQDAQGPQGHVLQVADWGGDDVEGAHDTPDRRYALRRPAR